MAEVAYILVSPGLNQLVLLMRGPISLIVLIVMKTGGWVIGATGSAQMMELRRLFHEYLRVTRVSPFPTIPDPLSMETCQRNPQDVKCFHHSY